MLSTPMMITTIMTAAIPGRKYWSARLSGCGVAAVEAAGSPATVNEDIACEGQYDSLPSNDAYTT